MSCRRARSAGTVVGVSEPTPEPSLSTILDAINALAAKVDSIDTRLGAVETGQQSLAAKVDAIAAEQQIISGKLDQLAQDVMAVKVDTGFIDRHIGDFQGWARSHETNPDAHRRAA